MAADTPAGTRSARGASETSEPGRLERAAARTVAESKATVPHLYAEVEAAVPWLDPAAGPDHRDAVVWAAARALRATPRINGAYRDGRFESYERVNVGIVVVAGDAFLVPTIFDADRKEPDEIAAESRRLEAAAGAGELAQPQLSGGTFTVSAPAAERLAALTPIVHRGQAAILGAGVPAERPVVRGGKVTTARTLRLVLACDHRIVPASAAAAFLDAVAALLERGPDG